MPAGRCLIGRYPGFAATKPAAAKAVYPGTCKFLGYNAFAGKTAGAGFAAKGMCMGMGLGVLGPLLFIGAGVAGGYYILKKCKENTTKMGE